MSYTSRIDWEVLRTFDSASLSGTYQALGTPLLHSAYKWKIINNSNVLITISNDGINDKDVIPANSFCLYDESIVGLNGQYPALPKGCQISVKGSAGVGLVYLVIQYIITN